MGQSDIIFDQLTVEAFRRFIKINSIENIRLNLSKDDLKSEIKDRYLSDETFKSIFTQYVKDVEIAGRKDFWFFKASDGRVPNEMVQQLRTKVGSIPDDHVDVFTPDDVDIPRYFTLFSDGDTLKVKTIRKKIVQEIDPTRTRQENGETLVVFVNKELRHVSYYEVNLSTGIMICGIDVWKNLPLKNKLAQLKEDIDYIFGNDFYQSLISIDIKENSKQLLEQENVLTKSLSMKGYVHIEQGTTFTISKSNISQVRKELNDGTLQLNQIKTRNIQTDVKDNDVLKAAEKESLILTTSIGVGVLFYYDDQLLSHEYIRFELYADDSRVKFLNDYLTLKDLNNVFSKII